MSALGAPIRPWPRVALVMFSGVADLWWLRLLRPGFRHCFVALRFADGWVVVNPMAHQTEVGLYAAARTESVARHYRVQGMTVVACPVYPAPRRPLPWSPFTCVETAKRLLGVQMPGIFTPWQLYKHINHKKMKKSVDSGNIKG